MISKLQHEFDHVAGMTMSWCSTDTQSLFDNNFKKSGTHALLAEQGWINCNIEYKFNSHGFRGPEFDQRDCFIVLGCSFVAGIGLLEEQTFTYILSKKLNLHGWNLGVPGGSPSTCYRVARHYIPYLNPQYVIYLEPRSNRIELFWDNTFKVLNFTNDEPFLKNRWGELWITNKENQLLYADSTRDAIQFATSKINANFINYEGDYLTTLDDHTRARDLMHPGVTANQRMAEQLYQTIVNNYNHE